MTEVPTPVLDSQANITISTHFSTLVPSRDVGIHLQLEPSIALGLLFFLPIYTAGVIQGGSPDQSFRPVLKSPLPPLFPPFTVFLDWQLQVFAFFIRQDLITLQEHPQTPTARTIRPHHPLQVITMVSGRPNTDKRAHKRARKEEPVSCHFSTINCLQLITSSPRTLTLVL